MNVAREGSNGHLLPALIVLVAAAGSLAPARAEAQCQVVSPPSLFDPVVPGPTFTPQPNRLAVAGPAGARRLLVRYNYGFVTYDLAFPAAPQKLQSKDLRFNEAYPVAGDGQTRAGMISASSDGARALVPWGSSEFGTIVLSPTPYSGGGEYLPTGGKTKATAALRTGNRYLAFSSNSAGALWVADVTTVARDVKADPENPNQIGSWPYTGPSFGGNVLILKAVESAAGAYLVAASDTNVTVIDVSAPGPAGPGITNGFSHRTYTLSELGLSGKLRAVSAALHPTDGGLYLLAEGSTLSVGVLLSNGVSLTRIQPPANPGGQFGSAEPKGFYLPETGFRRAMPDSVLLSVDTELVAVFVEGEGDGTGGPLHLQVRSSSDFGQNLAAGLEFTSPAQLEALDGFRSTGGSFHLYMGLLGVGTYAASISCTLAPTPADGAVSVEKIPSTGAPVAVPDNGTVFVGDELQIRPTFAPPDYVKPLTDWRFDYAFHEGDPTDASATTPFIMHSDIPWTPGDYPSLLTLIGPCDPSQDGVPNPTSGAGCWSSVVASGDFASPDPAAGTTVQIPLAFEVRNALNEVSSDLTKHRIQWKVPRPLLKSASILSGEYVEDGSEGTPDRTSGSYRWYFASAPVGQTGSDVLTLKADCTGPICNPGLTQRGEYRYWLSVPYRNGFRTPDCPGLVGATCTVPTAPTVSVTDVILGFSVPESGNVGAQVLTIGSTSKKGTATTPCGGTSGFTYDVCTVSGGVCQEGSYAGVGFVATNPFPATGAGTVTIPMPQEGSWGVRIRYQYTTTGDCGNGNANALTAKWPDQGQWAPFTVFRSAPTVKLFNSTGTSELPKWGGTYSLTTCQTARAYAYVDGVQEAALPSGASFTLTKTDDPPAGPNDLPVSQNQYASISVSTRGDYVVTLRGYGVDATANIAAEAPLGGGGGTPTPVISAPAIIGAGSPDGTASIVPHSGSIYDWSISGGSITSGSNESSITFTAGDAGTLTLYASEQAPGECWSSAGTATVQVLPAASALRFYPVTPCRVLDTRDASGPTLGLPLAGDDTLGSDVAGTCGVSPTARAVAANVTVTQSAGSGYVVVFPGDEPEPVTSTVHFSAGRTRASNTHLKLSMADLDDISVKNASPGPVHVIIDVSGYYE